MRRSRLTIILAVLTIAIVAPLYFLLNHSSAKPAISFGHPRYGGGIAGRWFRVELGVTNTGHVTMRYSLFYFGESAVLRRETTSGWTTNDGPLTVAPLIRAQLPPGSNTFAVIEIPPDTQRWQVEYTVHTASSRDRVLEMFPMKWRGRLRPICERLFSQQEGPPHKFLSEVLEVPYMLKIGKEDAPRPFNFEPLSPLPTAAERW